MVPSGWLVNDYVFALFWVFGVVYGQGCKKEWNLPEACVCSTNTVRCLFSDLQAVPVIRSAAITILDLRYNKIPGLARGSFQEGSKYQTVILSNNGISQLGDHAFSGISHTRNLWLDSNGLAHISSKAFHGLKALETLHLETNRLRSIHPDTFSGLQALEKVFLQENELLGVPPHLFHSTALKRLRVDRNPFHCNCEILWLTLLLQNVSDSGALCATPLQQSGRAVATLSSLTLACDPPRILRQPDDVDASMGQSVQLHCQAVGNPHPAVVWMHNEQEIRPAEIHHHHSVMSNGALKVDMMDVSAEGSYQCMAKSPVGETKSRKVTIRNRNRRQTPHFRAPPVVVQTAGATPRFSQKPQNFDVRDGETIQLSCEARGHPEPLIAWKHDGQPLNANGRNGIRVGPTGTINIDNPDRTHNGVYECTAKNIHGTIRSSARVRVRVRPVIIEAPKDSVAYVGGRMTLRCRADGFPAPSLTWVQNGIPTPTTFVHDISRDGTELTFLNVTREDAGVYRCFAQNSAGTAGASAVLTVHDDVSLIPDHMDVRNHIIPEITAVVNQAREHIDSAEFPRTQSLQAAARQVIRISPETEALRATFERSLRLMDEKVKRGMVFDNVTAFVYNESIPFLHVQLIANLSGCAIHRRVVKDCTGCYHKKYRTFDGTCNNLKKPMQGASFTGLRRILPPLYSDGLSQPVGARAEEKYHGFSKPSARLVSTKVLSTANVTADSRHSHMLMQWGQFLDHDLSFTVMAPSHEIFTSHANCKSSCTTEPPCFPIPIPANDTRMHNETCLEFIRSRPVCGSGTSSVLFSHLMPREQINSLTSYIDASMIYGSSEEVARHIRDHTSRGLFRSSLPAPGTDLPLLPYHDPLTAPEEIDCKRVRNDERNFPCFTAGEIRVNEQLGLLAMHTLWFREHNRLAEKLGEVNPQWSGEKVFQETRKIVGAAVQHITYDQWLPKILGPAGMQLLGKYDGYRDDVDASIANSFATATLRMGHSTIFPILRRLNNSFETIAEGDLDLHETFFAPHRIFDQGGIDPLLRGLFGTPAKLLQKTQLMNTELIEKLFGKSTKTHRVPLDLGAFNIQRARDHGLPPYVAFRKLCNLAVPQTFAGFRNEMDADQLKRLEDAYGHPGNVDLFAGAMSERPLPGAKIGATFMCLLVEQFKRLRHGDRFWYEKEGVLTPEQVKEIKSSSLSRILCDNTDTIDKVQKDIFLLASTQGGYKWCEDIAGIDLSHWKECCEDCYLTRANDGASSVRPRRHLDNAEENKVKHLQREIDHLQAVVKKLRGQLRSINEAMDVARTETQQ